MGCGSRGLLGSLVRRSGQDAVTFGKGSRSSARILREAVATAQPRQGRVVVEIPESMYRAINRQRGVTVSVTINGVPFRRPATFAEAFTSVLERAW